MTTIIAGVDRSPGARSALRVAGALARRMSARLIAVHVRDRSSPTDETAEQVAAAIVADVVPNADVVARGATGDVAEGLAEVARAEGASMIVVGARRRGRSRAFLRARSAVGLVGATDIPVLVAPLPAVASRVESVDTRRLLDVVPRRKAEPVTDHVAPRRTTVEEQRRLRRKSRVAIRPSWSRGRS